MIVKIKYLEKPKTIKRFKVFFLKHIDFIYA